MTEISRARQNARYAEDFVNVKDFGVIGDGVTDDSAAWQTILSTSAIDRVHFPKGTYKFLSSSTCTRDIVITADEGTVIDCTDGSYSGNYWTEFSGSALQIEDLNANVSEGDTSFDLATTPSLVRDDIFTIFNSTNSSYSGFRTDYKEGEFCRVIGVSTNTISLDKPLYSAYTAASVDVYKITPVTVTIEGLDIQGDVSTDLINIVYGRDCKVRNVSSSHTNNSTVKIDRCYNTLISGCNLDNEGDGGDDYGLSIANSQHVKVVSSDIYGRRHCINIGGTSATNCVPPSDILVEGCTLRNDPASGVHNADFHGNARESQYRDCTIYGGATWQGKNNGYVNCKIYGMAIGVCVLSAEILGGSHYIRGCELFSYADANSGGRGIVDVGGNSSVLTTNTTETVNLEITDTIVVGQNQGSGSCIMRFENSGTTQDINTKLDGLTLKVNDMSAVLITRSNSGTNAGDYTIVDNVVAEGLTGKLLVNHSTGSGGNYSAIPMRLQVQSGTEELTTNTGAPNVAGTAVVFNWAYPKEPAVVFGRSDIGLIGNRVGIAHAATVSSTGLTPSIRTDDNTNFSSASAVDVSWRAAIEEV